MNDKTEQTVTDALVPAIQQFQGRDGAWHNFIDDRHFQNTVEDGSWPMRNLYTQEVIDTLRTKLAEQFRELIAKEAERAARELECNNAQRQHTMQCAINKTDSQRILELTSQLAEAQRELKELHESRNALIERDHELTLKWAEAQRDSERLDWMIEQRAYVVSDPDCCDGYWLNYPRPDGTLWTQATEHETPRAAIDAAMGEQ